MTETKGGGRRRRRTLQVAAHNGCSHDGRSHDGRYPSREEILEVVKGSVVGEAGGGQEADEQAPRSSGCEPGSGCC